jgi:hypothetical protein
MGEEKEKEEKKGEKKSWSNNESMESIESDHRTPSTTMTGEKKKAQIVGHRKGHSLPLSSIPTLSNASSSY